MTTTTAKKSARKSSLKLYTWNWIGGGYNACMAQNRREAIRKAREISDALVPNLHSLRQVSSQEMDEINRSWRSACD